MARRKPRAYEKTCDCAAYKFPHRLFGGRCDGSAIVQAAFNDNRDCNSCILNDCNTCQVLDGIENTNAAPCVQEFIRFEGVKPPSAWREGLRIFTL